MADTENTEYVNQWRLWVYRYEQERLQGRTHPQDRLLYAAVRKLEADLLDPSHRGAEAGAAYEAMRQAALDLIGPRTIPT